MPTQLVQLSLRISGVVWILLLGKDKQRLKISPVNFLQNTDAINQFTWRQKFPIATNRSKTALICCSKKGRKERSIK